MYGSFLRQVRTSRHLTQVQLAEIVGISQPNLSAYENDRRSPSLDVANRILVACGYVLVADAGAREVRCPLPEAGWFVGGSSGGSSGSRGGRSSSGKLR